MSPATRRRRAGGEKRTLVLTAVAEVLAERGYENTRFRDVAATADIAISTLQNYFGSREDMVIEALELATDREVAQLEAVAAAHHDPWRRLVAMIDRSLDTPEPAARMLIEFWRSAMRDDELRESSAEVVARYRAPFLAAVCDGGFSLTHRPDDVVDLVLAALAGAILFRAQRHPTPSTTGFRAVLLTQLAAMLGTTLSSADLSPRSH